MNENEILQQKHYKVPFVTDLRDMIYNSANRYKRRTAFKLKDEKGNVFKITYDNVKKDFENFATGLLNLGLAGKKIAVIGKNSYHWAIGYLASSCIGIVVPIDKELSVNDYTNYINVAECSAVIADDKQIELIQQNSNLLNYKSIKYINTDLNYNKKDTLSFKKVLMKGKILVKRGSTEFRDMEINPDDMHFLLFTSGTTGNAKGVCLSHTNICSDFMATCKMVKFHSKDSVLSILPIHHTYECTIGFLLVLYRGGRISYCDGLKYISKNITEYSPTTIVCVPLLLENVYKKIIKNITTSLPDKYKNKLPENAELVDIIKSLPLLVRKVVTTKVHNSLGGRIRLFITGAAAISPTIVEGFNSLKFRVLQGYGLTECAPLIAGSNDFFYRHDSAGMAIPGVEIQIDSANEEGIGEVIAKGPNIMLGYYKNEEDTNKVLKNGWFHTGDLGYMDNNGWIYLTGRSKNVIVTKNGKNIYPEEVEYYLNDNPLISESLVMGLNYDDDDETYVNAQIFPNIDAIKEYLQVSIPTKEEISATINDIISEVNKKLPNYKHIKGFKIRDEEFEKTTTKKIKRFGDNMKK